MQNVSDIDFHIDVRTTFTNIKIKRKGQINNVFVRIRFSMFPYYRVLIRHHLVYCMLYVILIVLYNCFLQSVSFETITKC